MQSIDDLIPYLENIKISAFRKAELIKNDVHNVTIGPDSSPPKSKEIEISATSPVVKCSPKKETEVSQDTLILPIRQIIREYEIERQQKVRKAVESHTKQFEIFSAQQNITRKQQWLMQQQKFVESMQQQEQEIMLALKEYEDRKSNDHEKLRLHYQELEEQRRKTAAVLEAKKKERQLLNECLDNQAVFHSLYQEIMMMIKSCQDEKLKAGMKHIWMQFKELHDLMTALISKSKTITVSVEEKKTAEAIVRRATQLKNDVETLFRNEQLKKQQESQKEIEKTEQQPPQISNTENNALSVLPPPVTNVKPKEHSVASFLDVYVSKLNFKWYSEITAFHEKYGESFQQLLNDDRLKQFRFDCKKAVNLSVNAISAVNPQHLRDKYVKLSNLLQGRNTVIGDFQINASKHPNGIQFCTDLLANKFVLQGDLMISSNPEAAFSFATIIVSLWNESPDFGKILLAHFFKECPYLVPIYIPKAVDQTDEDYYKNQGYRYTDGQIEKQDKFLKRMTGIMRLYFAILISTPKQGQNKNPHNIKIAWTWFVSVLKLEPRLDITATMLHTFLETVGFEMQNTYKMQFFKLLRFFVEQYFPSLKKIDSGGPVTRLECLFQEFKENRNQFKPPNGILSKNFW